MRTRLTQAVLCLAPLTLGVGCAAPPGGLPWQAKPDTTGVTFVCDGQSLLRYRFGGAPFKPYVQTLATPGGINILRDAPADHLHHHGLMFAVNVDEVEFWGEADPAGSQRPRYLQIIPPRTVKGLYKTGLIQTLNWLAPDGQVVMLQEKRTIETWRSSDLDASLISWQSELHTPPHRDSVQLVGRKYFGLGMRFVKSMDTGGRFFNADRGEGVKGTDDVPSRWCAYTASADGHVVTVAVFDHPRNPRHPARWFTMDTPFAYMTATPGLHHEPLALSKSHPLRFRYGVAVWDGQVEPKRIQSLYRRWAALPAAE